MMRAAALDYSDAISEALKLSLKSPIFGRNGGAGFGDAVSWVC
jgi:hypothetical protein